MDKNTLFSGLEWQRFHRLPVIHHILFERFLTTNISEILYGDTLIVHWIQMLVLNESDPFTLVSVGL